MERMKRHLTYANVAATLALVLAMSGGAVAATGGFSSGGTLRACANEEGAIRLLKPGKHCGKGQKSVSWNQTGPAGARGSVGPAGAAGVAGPTGPGGAKGAEGPQGSFANVTVRTQVAPNFNAGSAPVVCLPGERAVGGGASSNSGGDSKITSSEPIVINGVPTEWDTGFDNEGTNRTTTFFAICVS